MLDESGTRKAVEDVLAKFDAAYDKHDAAAIAALYAETGTQVPARPSPTFGAVVSGRPNIEKFFVNAFHVFGNQSQKLIASGPLGGDAIWYVSELHLTGQGPNGPVRIDGHLGGVLIRNGSGWEIVMTTANGGPPSGK
jgi:uncharacterized protein (TIGR02246 family)